MSNRTYANFILLDRVLSNLPINSQSDQSLINSVLAPNFRIVSADCGTTIGRRLTTDYSLVGHIDLKTGSAFTSGTITAYLAAGQYISNVRTSNTCIHRNGICKKCYHASYPIGTVPEANVGDIVSIQPTDTTAFLKYLADSYSGSLFGMQPMPVSNAPLPMEVYKSLISANTLDLLKARVSDSPLMTTFMSDYIDSINDSLEKALLLLMMFGIDSAAIR